MFIQMHLFNDADHTNQYTHLGLAHNIKMEAGRNRVGSEQKRVRERKREAD